MISKYWWHWLNDLLVVLNILNGRSCIADFGDSLMSVQEFLVFLFNSISKSQEMKNATLWLFQWLGWPCGIIFLWIFVFFNYGLCMHLFTSILELLNCSLLPEFGWECFWVGILYGLCRCCEWMNESNAKT